MKRLSFSLKSLSFSVLLAALFALPAAGQGDGDLPRQGVLGAQVSALPPETRAQLKLPDAQGIVVQRVDAKSSAEAAGVKTGDIILKANDADVNTAPAFVAVIRPLRADQKVALTVLRDGKQQIIDATLKPRPFETSPDFDVLYRAVNTRGGRRRVIVTKPKAAGRVPAVLMVGGIGCYSLDNFPPDHAYRRILYDLTRQGFATMRVEKTGVGDSEGAPCASPQADLRQETEGYVAGLRALKTFDFVDADKVFIVGHSIGGIVGPLVAGEEPVRGIVAIATVGTTWFEYGVENYRRQGVMRGAPYDVLERELKLYRRCRYRLWVEGQTPEQVVKDDQACADYVRDPAPYTYMQQLTALNLSETWKKAVAPALVMYGASDFLTSTKEHEYLRDLINSFRPGGAKYVEIPQMDHYFERAATQRASMERLANPPQQPPSSPPQFVEQAVTEISTWLKQTLNAPPIAAAISQPPAENLSAADFQNLRWLEGDWRGSENGGGTFYERYRFVAPDRIEMQSYADQAMTRAGEDKAVIFLKDGVIYYQGAGGSAWVVERLNKTEAVFAPRERASNSFVWKSESPDAWTAEIIYPARDGQRRRNTYRLERIKK